MIMKQLYCWKRNMWDEDFGFFGLVILGCLLLPFAAAMLTYWGVSIFGPWFEGSKEVWYLTWVSAIVQMFYFWTRYARYASLSRRSLMNPKTGEMIARPWYSRKPKVDKKAEERKLKLDERKTALGFAESICK